MSLRFFNFRGFVGIMGYRSHVWTVFFQLCNFFVAWHLSLLVSSFRGGFTVGFMGLVSYMTPSACHTSSRCLFSSAIRIEKKKGIPLEISHRFTGFWHLMTGRGCSYIIRNRLFLTFPNREVCLRGMFCGCVSRVCFRVCFANIELPTVALLKVEHIKKIKTHMQYRFRFHMFNHVP